MADDEVAPIVIDNGSSKITAGFAGEDGPRAVFPNIAARGQRADLSAGLSRDWFVGNEAVSMRSTFPAIHPVQRGVVTNWDAMEQIWHHIFYNELQVAPYEHPVLMTESLFNPKANREKMTQIMFETFTVPALYASLQPLLSLYASGKTAGLVCESGDGLTQVLPASEGYPIFAGATRLEIGGQDLTDYLVQTLRVESSQCLTSTQANYVGPAKEHCFVALDHEDEVRKTCHVEKSYELPDKTAVVTLGKERFMVPEALFQPAVLGQDFGLHDVIYNSIRKCPVHTWKDLYGHILLSGGNTMFPGMVDRMKKEITALAPLTMKTKTVAPPERKYSTWIGGSILAAMSTFQQMWISKQEYDEVGPEIVHRKCQHFN